MSDYFINYLEANIVCLIIFGIMLFRDLLNVDRQEKQIKYDRALVAFMAYFVSDSLWSGVYSGILPKTLFTVIATNFFNFVIMALMTHAWLNYVMAVEQVEHRERRINKFAVLFPLLLSTAALIVTYVVAPNLLIGEDLELQPAFNAFQITVPIIYIVAVLIYALRRAKNEVNSSLKKEHIYIGLFPLMLIIGGLIQILLIPRTPLFCFCCTILMLIFYIQSMEAKISIDPLTNLNNRGQLMRYVSQENNNRKEGRLSFVMMIDINDFKSINDSFGHSEGDHALKIIADSLKNVVNKHSIPSFLGRYGGDEFILIIHPSEKDDVESFIGEIRSEIDSRCSDEETGYKIGVGIGCDEYMGGQDTFQKCIQRADHKLYLDKEYTKLNDKKKKD